MDYIQYAIDFLDKNNHGISAGRARDQYAELKSRLAQLEAAEHSVHPTVCQCGEDCIPMLGEDTCVRCDLPLAHIG